MLCRTCTEERMKVMQNVYRGVHDGEAGHVQRSA